MSGTTATRVAIFGDTRGNKGHRRLVEVLSQMALLGAGAITALLSRSAG
ncbi:hypothetical protein [Chelativorans salis]|uniref:Uncharacterized protein n=1 Tax=Chelativorans salis TaxID=2978478 RepID=A0ABT2LUH9_9HYPH|nr:hypothetical protein [Chelativorans sp. EGI FJ00035]MCT7378172.1 hypothetical protein [Chelativorans sp. EGI FJ00035]